MTLPIAQLPYVPIRAFLMIMLLSLVFGTNVGFADPTEPQAEPPKDPGAKAVAAPVEKPLALANGADRRFVQQAGEYNLAVMTASQLAMTRSQNQPVKALAQMLIDDHMRATTILAAVADQAALPLPDVTDKKHELQIERLMNLSGVTFDQAYLKLLVKDHTAMARFYATHGQTGAHPAVKTYAADTLPKIQHHSQAVQTLAIARGVK